MPNQQFGNIWYFDTNGAINNSKNIQVQKIAIYGTDTRSLLTFAIGTGIPAVVLSFANSGALVDNNWREVNFNPPLYCNQASILTVNFGSGYVFLA